MRETRWASQDVKVVQFYARLAPFDESEPWLVAYMTLASATLFLLQFYAPIDQLSVARIQRSGRSVLLEVPASFGQVQTRAKPAQTPRSAHAAHA